MYAGVTEDQRSREAYYTPVTVQDPATGDNVVVTASALDRLEKNRDPRSDLEQRLLASLDASPLFKSSIQQQAQQKVQAKRSQEKQGLPSSPEDSKQIPTSLLIALGVLTVAVVGGGIYLVARQRKRT
jgi:hypothetical protein